MANYVVSQPGNDSTGTGSEGTPWKTIARAVQVANPGDTIIVRGTLTGTNQTTISNTYLASAYLTIRPHDTDGGLIDGQWTYPTTGSGYLSGPDGDGHWGPLINLTGRYIKWQVPVTRSKGRNVGVAGQNITLQNYFAGQYLNLTWARNAGFNANTAQDITCIGVNVEYSGSFYQGIRDPSVVNWPVAFNFVRTPNVLVSNCRSFHNWGEGISAGRASNNVTIEKSIFLNNMSVVAYVNRCDTVLWDRCIIGHDGNADGFNQSSGLALRNERNPGTTPPLRNITVVNCLLLGAKNNLLIANNQEIGDTIENVYVYHNTFINATSVDNTHFNLRAVSSDRSNINIKRNIFWQSDGRWESTSNYGAGEYFYNQNSWVGSGGSPNARVIGAGDVSGVSMVAPNTAWTAAGAGFNDTFLDNYRPSNEYSLGSIVAAGGVDLESTARTFYSIGAIEYGSSVTPPPTSSTGNVATVVRAVTNTTTGNQTINYTLDEVPTMVIIFVGQATADNTPVANAIGSIGACTTSTQRAISFWAQDAVATTNSGRAAIDDGIIYLQTNTGGVDGKGSFVSMTAASLVINWSDAPAAARVMEIWLFSGTNGYVTAASVNATQNASTTVTTGFQVENDTLVFVFGNGRTIPNTSGNADAITSFGVATHNGASIVQAVAAQNQADNEITSVSGGRISESYVSGNPGVSGGWVWSVEFANITATSFDLTTRNGALGSAAHVLVAAVKFDTALVHVDTIATPTGAGNQAYTGFGFRPGWVGLFSSMFAALDTSYTDGSAGAFGVGAATVDSEASLGWASEDNSPDSDTQSIADSKLVNTPQHDGSAGLVATLTSMDSDGFTANYSTVLGGAVLSIVVGIEGSDQTVALSGTEESFAQDGGSMLVTVGMVATEESFGEDGGVMTTGISVIALSATEESFGEDGGVLIHAAITTTSGLTGRTYPDSPGLTVSVYEPLSQGGGYLFDMTEQLSSLSFETVAMGGFWTARARVAGRQGYLEEWFERGLQRRIVVSGPENQTVWEGFVNRITLNLGGLTKSTGPVMGIFNRVQLIYSLILTGLSDPEIGIRVPTTWAEDTASQSRWGILNRVLSSGGATPETAESIRDDYLRENSRPETDEEQNIGGSISEPTMDIELLGYVHSLQSYVFNSTTTGTTTTTAQLQAILNAEPNNFITHSYGFLSTNSLALSAYDNDNRVAWNTIKEIVAKGDSADNRYLFGIYDGRIPHYAPVVDQIDYLQSLSDPAQRITTTSGQHIKPWDVQAGKWLFSTDFMVGRVPEATALREDPRAEFIESVSFQSPWSVTVRGSKVRRLDQKLAKLGLAGIGG